MTIKSRFFSTKELACPCCGEYKVSGKLIDILDTIRYALNKPMRLNSVYRCEKHNAEVGGAKDSQHLKGCAADIHCDNSADRFYIVFLAGRNGASGIGVDGSYVHIDVREAGKAMWLYPGFKAPVAPDEPES